MGAPVAQYGDVLVEAGPRRERWLERGWSALRRRGIDLVDLPLVRADAVLGHCNLLALTPPLRRQEAPFADLALRVAPDGPSIAYSARDRSGYRRRLRRLGARGEITLSCLAPGPEARALAEQAIALKRASLSQHGAAAAVSDPRFGRFLAALAADRRSETGLRVSVVSCNGSPVGIDLSFDCGGRSFRHLVASDRASSATAWAASSSIMPSPARGRAAARSSISWRRPMPPSVSMPTGRCRYATSPSR